MVPVPGILVLPELPRLLPVPGLLGTLVLPELPLSPVPGFETGLPLFPASGS